MISEGTEHGTMCMTRRVNALNTLQASNEAQYVMYRTNVANIELDPSVFPPFFLCQIASITFIYHPHPPPIPPPSPLPFDRLFLFGLFYFGAALHFPAHKKKYSC